MDFFSEDPHSVVSPRGRVMALTPPGKSLSQELSLEGLAFITFTSQDLQRLIQSGLPSKPVEAWRDRGFRIFRGQVRDEGWIAVRSPYGAPGTVMLLEELVAFGVKRAILLGYCGALLEGIEIGDIVLPVEAVREEGTSYHYLPKNEKSCPDLALQHQLSDWIGGVGLSTLRGRVWTTDAPYRETPEKVRAYRAEGVLGVEMEMAAAFAFGKAKGISVGSVLIVSDQVREGEWHVDFFSPRIQSAREKVAQALLGHLPELVAP
jgi:uridine phosphorylase